MTTPWLLPDDAKKFIASHCSMTGEELRQEIIKKYKVDVSVQAVLEHVKKARKEAEEITRCADAHIAKSVAERIEKFLPNIINFYEKDLLRLMEVIEGRDPAFDMKDVKDDSGLKFDKYWQEKYRKLFIEESESYLKMRPPISTVRVESTVDPDVAVMDTWSDEKLKEYEKFLDKIKDMD